MSNLLHVVKQGLRWRGPVLMCLLVVTLTAGTADARGIPERLKAGLSSSSPKVRVLSVAGVARSKDRGARALLEPLLADPDPMVRSAVLDALAAIGDPIALAAIEKQPVEADARVAAVRQQALERLRARQVLLDTSDLQDLSGAAPPGLLDALREGVEEEIRVHGGPGFVLKRGGVDKGWGLLIRLRSVKQIMRDGSGQVELKCELTVVELPGKILRLSSSASAAAGVEGPIPKGMAPELARDGINACAPALAKDFLEFHAKRTAAR